MNQNELRDFMSRHQLSVEQLARLLGYTPTAVQYWLNGNRKISVLVARTLRMFDKWPGLMQVFAA